MSELEEKAMKHLRTIYKCKGCGKESDHYRGKCAYCGDDVVPVTLVVT